MKYQYSEKIIIDKRKLDLLLRIGCPKETISQLLFTGEYASTGDSMIDDNLDSLIDFKKFDNWGGARSNSGRKSKENNQVDNQVDNHLENQDSNQVGDTDNDTDIDKYINSNISKSSKIKRPTLEEIKAYCIERNNTVDPEKFFNYYQSNGWKVGRNAMKDWMACVRTWEKSSFDKPKLSKQEQINKNTKSVYEQVMQEAIKKEMENGRIK